jgi:hypothetical protein
MMKAFAHHGNLYACFVGKHTMSKNQYVGIRIVVKTDEGIDEFIFALCVEDGIAEDEVLIPEAFFGIWKIYEGDIVDVVFVDRESLTWNGQHTITCSFVGYTKAHHWDELEFNHISQGVGSIISEWPTKLNMNSLQSMGALLLNNYLLFHGCKVMLKVMDITMVSLSFPTNYLFI